MKDDVSDAIRKQRCITLYYDPGVREIEPHTIGRSSEGNLLMRAYQTSGASASGEHEHWKLFRVDRIRTLDVLDATFLGPRAGYKKGDRVMKGGIIAEL